MGRNDGVSFEQFQAVIDRLYVERDQHEDTEEKWRACVGQCESEVPLSEVDDQHGHTTSEHANDESCRRGECANCPVPYHCGPVILASADRLTP